MGASVAYPVDSLRSATFTKRMGTSPSIMDYARFNYVAQPEDGDVGLMPDIGAYDKWSIYFGYKHFEGETTDSENAILNTMIKEKAGDPIYRFGRQRGLPLDHTSQTEDLGDDSMLASEYGIKNLQRIVPNLIEWTGEEGKEFENLDELYGNVVGQFRRYIGHVVGNIGGVKEVFKTFDQNEQTYVPNDIAKQRRAMQFLNTQLFNTPNWLIDQNILRRIESDGNIQRIEGLHNYTINILFNNNRMDRLADNESLHGSSTYTLSNLFDDSKDMIFTFSNPDVYQRGLQRRYVDKMMSMIKEGYTGNADARALARHTLESIMAKTKKLKKSGGDMTKAHFADLHSMILKELQDD